MENAPTAHQRLATMMLGQDVLAWVRSKRDADPPASWQSIADALDERTSGAVSVSRESIRLWYGQAIAEAAA